MAIKKDEVGVKKETPILKKRTAPEDLKVEKVDSPKPSPLKKRVLPGDEPSAENNVASLLKKRELPKEENNQTEQKEKSSLDKMKERIAAQKKLEQDMMTQQTLKNQEKVGMRNKLSALQKDLASQADEEETVVKVKPNISMDLKSEALDAQNKKLKQDVEKYKEQLQTLLSVEYLNTKVLDSKSLSLNEEFLNSLNAQLNVSNKASDESLKEELNEKITDLNKQIKEQEKQIEKLQSTKEALSVDKQDAQKENKKLAAQVATLTAQLSEQNKDQKECDKLQNKVNSLQSKIDEQDKELKELQEKISIKIKEAEESIAKIKQLESNQTNSDNVSKEKAELEKKLEEQSNKIDELLMNYQVQLDEKDKEINTLRQEVIAKEKHVEQLNGQVSKLPSLASYDELQSKYNTLSKENKEATDDLNKLKVEKEQFVNILRSLRNEKVDIIKVLIRNGKNISAVEKQITEINSLINDNQFDMSFIKTEIEKYENECRIKVEDNIGQVDLEKIKELKDEISSLEFKLKENSILEEELKEQYNKYVASERKFVSENKPVKKLLCLVQEHKTLNEAAKAAVNALSLIDPKTNKKAYRAKLAESKSMNSKVSYLERQIKTLNRNRKVKEYTKLVAKVQEFDEQFKNIEKRNEEIKLSINQKQVEINELKG